MTDNISYSFITDYQKAGLKNSFNKGNKAKRTCLKNQTDNRYGGILTIVYFVPSWEVISPVAYS